MRAEGPLRVGTMWGEEFYHRGFAGGSLCTSSGHKSSITARMESSYLRVVGSSVSMGCHQTPCRDGSDSRLRRLPYLTASYESTVCDSEQFSALWLPAFGPRLSVR